MQLAVTYQYIHELRCFEEMKCIPIFVLPIFLMPQDGSFSTFQLSTRHCYPPFQHYTHTQTNTHTHRQTLTLTHLLETAVGLYTPLLSYPVPLLGPCLEGGFVTPSSTAQHSTAQHSTAQHSTAQHSTAHHITAHHTHSIVADNVSTIASWLSFHIVKHQFSLIYHMKQQNRREQ